MVVCLFREQANNENFALSDAVAAHFGRRSKWPFVAELDRLRLVEPLVGEFRSRFQSPKCRRTLHVQRWRHCACAADCASVPKRRAATDLGKCARF